MTFFFLLLKKSYHRHQEKKGNTSCEIHAEVHDEVHGVSLILLRKRLSMMQRRDKKFIKKLSLVKQFCSSSYLVLHFFAEKRRTKRKNGRICDVSLE